jgi:hypothetical protein
MLFLDFNKGKSSYFANISNFVIYTSGQIITEALLEIRKLGCGILMNNQLYQVAHDPGHGPQIRCYGEQKH